MDKLMRLILSGIVAGFILFLVASISYNINGSISDPSISKLFRETISMKWFYKLLLINIGSGFFMAFLYALAYAGLPGNGIFKGVSCGFVMWIIMVHQPLIIQLVGGQLTQALLITWIAQGFVSYVAAGIGISLIYKN
jgi:hypothetical protein